MTHDNPIVRRAYIYRRTALAIMPILAVWTVICYKVTSDPTAGFLAGLAVVIPGSYLVSALLTTAKLDLAAAQQISNLKKKGE